jgi:hypothetical protein
MQNNKDERLSVKKGPLKWTILLMICKASVTEFALKKTRDNAK